MTRTLLAVALTGALLAGCGKTPESATSSVPAAAAPATAPAAESASAKFNAYTEGYNKLIDENWGVREMFEDHKEKALANASPSDEISFPENMSTLEAAITKLKEGRAVATSAGNAREADAAVDALLVPASALLAQWKVLTPYFETRAYRADQLAQYKAADAELTRNYEATLKAIDTLDAALTVHQRAQSVARADAFKKAGDMPLYHATDTMRLAELFVTAAMDEKTAEADTLLPQLEASLTALGTAHGAMAADAANRYEVGRVHQYVGSMIGGYRDFQQSGDASDMESVVDAYNNAIEEYGDIESPIG